MKRLSENQKRQRSEANYRHGCYRYEHTGQLPTRLEGFDRELARELLEHVGGDEAYHLLAQSAARRGTLLEIAYTWLARSDVPVFWAEEKNGHKVVRMQPILKTLGSWHEGLRRDLVELGLTPVSAAKLGLPSERGAIDYEEMLARHAARERKTRQERAAERGTAKTGDDHGELEDVND